MNYGQLAFRQADANYRCSHRSHYRPARTAPLQCIQRSGGRQQLNMGHGALKGTMGGLLIGLLSRQYVNTALLRRGKRRYLYCTIAEQTP